MTAHKHRVVVVGSGVGAIRVASLLSKDAAYEATIISPKHLFEMHGSLYRDSKGRSRRHVAIPLSKLFSHNRADADLVRGTVNRIDASKGLVYVQSGVDYPYDSLVLALPAVAKPIADIKADDVFSAYDIDSLASLRKSLVIAFESGQINGQNICVIGGGDTGVEIAAEVAMLAESLGRDYGVNKDSYKIALFEQSTRLMMGVDKKIGNACHIRLKELGVFVSFKKQAASCKKGLLTFDDGNSIKSNFIIHAAGRSANPLFSKTKDQFLLNSRGEIRVTSLLEAEGHNNIYLVGNCAESKEESDIEEVLYDSQFVVDVLHQKKFGRKLRRYDAPILQTRLDIGRRWAIVETGRLYVGHVGWIVKRWIDLKHFSTLLPKRLAFAVWLNGTKQDEVQK